MEKSTTNSKVSSKTEGFKELAPDIQQEVRRKQQVAKERRLLAKQQRKLKLESPPLNNSTRPNYDMNLDQFPTRITMDEYFDACRAGLYNCEGLECTKESVDVILRLISQKTVVGQYRDGSDATFDQFNYFRLSGKNDSSWNTELHAKLAYEGFFTITSDDKEGEERTPLTELQPFYSVICWKDFEDAKHVKNCLKSIQKSHSEFKGGCLKYKLRHTTDGTRVLQSLEKYQIKRNGVNWLTPKFLDMMKRTSLNPIFNFSLNVFELYEYDKDDLENGTLVAGEIGFSIGRIYTSLSGFSSRQTPEETPSKKAASDKEEVPESSSQVNGEGKGEVLSKGSNTGTTQLALLGRWLQLRGYSFWSMGHCYSPQMDYKRQLGHRILPRRDFLTLFRKHRGALFQNELGLDCGCEVELHSLAKRPDLNGTIGIVKEVPGTIDRFVIELVGKKGEMVKLKGDNIRRIQSPTGSGGGETMDSLDQFDPFKDGDEQWAESLLQKPHKVIKQGDL